MVIIGLGYVGLPLAIAAAKSNYVVVGVDLNQIKVENINKGISPIEDIHDIEIKDLITHGTFTASSDYSEIRDAKIVLICVPTPLTAERIPDLSNIENAVRSMSRYLSAGSIVILESTVAPGTTRNFLLPLIKSETKLSQNEFELAFSPERIDPLNNLWNLRNTPKLVAGLTEVSRVKAKNFYSKFVDHLVECDTLEIAETAKLLENSFRLINISFINELSKFCFKSGIDIRKVITSAATKPYGFMPFYPSVGVGGHCIPVDPLYLSSKAIEVDEPIQLIELASQINLSMPQYYVRRAQDKLKVLEKKKIIVIGVSYKPDLSDTRETPVEILIKGLKQKGAEVHWHDEIVKEWNGEKSSVLSNNFDLAILATPHANVDLTKLGEVPIIDTRGSI